MTAVKILYRLSDAGQRASLLSGGDGRAAQIVEVPQGAPDYAAAAALASITSDGAATLDHTATLYDGPAPNDAAPRYDAPQEAAALIAAEYGRRADRVARSASCRTQEAADLARRVAEWCALPLAERIERRYSTWSPTWDCGAIRATDAFREAAAECERRNAQESAERDAAERDAAAKKAAGIATLRAWAESTGSDLLRARIADGYSWESLASQEWCRATLDAMGHGLPSANVPDGYGDDPKIDRRTTPTLPEIETVRRLRTLCEGGPVAVALLWVTYTLHEDDCRDDYRDESLPPKVQRCEVRLTVTTPTGATLEYDYLPSA